MSAMQLASFRCFDAEVSPTMVLADLVENPVRAIVVRRRESWQTYWHPFEVDEDLLARLRKAGALREVLNLHEGTSTQPVPVPTGGSPLTIAAALQRTRKPTTLVDKAGTVVGVAVADQGPSPKIAGLSPGLPSLTWNTQAAQPELAKLFPVVDAPRGTEAAPGETLEFVMTLSAVPPVGVAQAFVVPFPPGVATVELIAEIASREFAVLPGQPSFHTFTVDRDLNVSPSAWSFEVVALGDRPTYSAEVVFHAGGTIAGTLSITVARKGVPLSGPARFASKGVALRAGPSPWAELAIVERGKLCDFLAFDGPQRIPLATDFGIPVHAYFDQLASAASLAGLKELGNALRIDLPPPVFDFLESSALAGRPILIESTGRVAPFECLQLKPSADGPFLGVEVPVLRWINDDPPTPQPIDVGRAVCIRPNYQGTSDLPEARAEEKELSERTDVTHVGTLSELRAVLDDEEIGLVHFAGHAQANPAFLKLEQNELLEPSAFHPSQPLLKTGKPICFLNGCLAGAGSAEQISMRDNLVKTLLMNGCRSVVAPFMKVHTSAARAAAALFYDAAATKTVGEAVQAVRARAMDARCADTERATFLSYAAFAVPTQRLTGLK